MIVSFETATKMKELWRDHKTHFAYCVDWKKKHTEKWIQFERRKMSVWWELHPIYRSKKRWINEWEDWISMVNAPTVDEVMDVLPEICDFWKRRTYLTIQKIKVSWIQYLASYRCKEDLSDLYASDESLADAVWQLWIKVVKMWMFY